MFNCILHEKEIEIRAEPSDLNYLKPRELCVFYASDIALLKTHETAIQTAIARSQMVIISISAIVATHPSLRQILKGFPGLFAVSIRYRLSSDPGQKFSGFVPHGFEGDLNVLNQYTYTLENFGFSGLNSVRIIPEIEVTDDLQMLGPTLMALSRKIPPWIMLGVGDEPKASQVKALKETFEYLQIRGFPLIDIYFSFDYLHARTWKAQTECFYSGPDEFHIDLSNKCTHSCVFCALYAPAIIDDLKSNGRFDENIKRFMSSQLDPEKAVELIQSLPVTTRLIQFGGSGDPMLHPKAIELITYARERDFPVEILSNMEYFKAGDHEKLTALGGFAEYSLRFIANISAATPETYVLTRPRQKTATFEKVVKTLRKFSDLREQNGGWGVHFDVMCVLNRLNYHEAPLFIELAKEVGATAVWFKPLEIHSQFHYDLLPKPEEQEKYLSALQKAMEKADRAGVLIKDRQYMEETLAKKQTEGHPCH